MKIVIPPSRTYETNSGKWDIYDPKTLGITTVINHSDITKSDLGVIFANPKLRVGSEIAWANGRQSRSPDNLVKIIYEIREKGIESDKKIEKFVNTYGHSSLADMAQVSIHFINVPMHFPMLIFNESGLLKGQEKSTRYQEQFKSALLHLINLYIPNVSDSLKKEYQRLETLALENFGQIKRSASLAYEKFYKPENKKEYKSLESRVLDSARFSLLLGQHTGFAAVASIREWSRIITHLKASNIEYYKNMGSQLEEFLSPEQEIEEYLGFKADSPSLVRHTTSDLTSQESFNKVVEFFGKKFLSNNYGTNLNVSEFGPKDFELEMRLKGIDKELLGASENFRGFVEQGVRRIDRKYTEGERTFAMYLLTLFPSAEPEKALSFIHNLKDEEKRELSKLIFGTFNYKQQMPNQFGGTTTLGAIVDTTFGEARDLNRHGPWQRFIQSMPLPYVRKLTHSVAIDIINKGFGLPEYFTRIHEFKELKNQAESGFYRYYDAVFKFIEQVYQEYRDDIGYEFIYNLLPLGHKTELIMHSTPKQVKYLTELRVRAGGHLNYRKIAFDLANSIATEPSLGALKIGKRPDPKNREEFFSRA